MRILMITIHSEKKVLIVFDDMIADITTNNEFKAIIKKLFIRCRTLNISFAFITQSCFSVPKYIRLNSTHYLIMKINDKRELRNIAFNHSADIDSKDVMKIYRECTKEPFTFLAIDTMLPATNPLRFRKNLFDSYKMTLTDQIEILDRKIMQNEAQYNLDKKGTKVSALSSNNLDKYEYLTGEDLGLKSSTVEQAKFEYSLLGKVLTKGLDKDDQKEGLFKRLKILKIKMKSN